MVSKKPVSKKAKPAAKRGPSKGEDHQGPLGITEELGQFPLQDPQAQAEYLLELLGRLAEVGDPRADNLRLSLLYVINGFLEHRLAGGDKREAVVKAARQLGELEVSVADLLIGSIGKLRDKMSQESRKLGTGSKAGQQVRQAVESLGMMTQGLELLVAAGREGDPQKRDQAHAIMKKAQAAVAAK